MPLVQMKVPIEGNEAERDGWLENVSQHIDAGDTVEFIDSNSGADVNISRVQLDTAGIICIYGKGYTIADAKTITLTAGEFHDIGGIHGFAAGTETGKGIHVKI